MGLVSKLPKSLPKSVTDLVEDCWAVVGSSLVSNGATVRENLSIGEQLQLKVNQTFHCA